MKAYCLQCTILVYVLSNQVVEEVQKHFSDMVFKTIIQRNVRLGEAPSFGESIINYDVSSKGASELLKFG